MESLPPKHPHVNPPPPAFKIPRSEWPRIVQRVAHGESLRQVARSYRVSYEAIRRIVISARRDNTRNEEESLEEEHQEVTIVPVAGNVGHPGEKGGVSTIEPNTSDR